MPERKKRRPTPVPVLPEFHQPVISAISPVREFTPCPQNCDIIGKVIGDFGIWQLRTALIIFLVKIPAAWFMACIIFTAPELYPGIDFECDANQDSYNISSSQCTLTNLTSEATETCQEFKYNSQFYSLIMQFNLVCDRDILIAWTQFWHLFGILVGGVLGTKMMIWISPKNVMLIGMVAQIACGVLTGYIPDFSLHCFFRCSSAVCCALMMTAGQTIFTEITAGNYRIGLVTLYDTFWSVGLFFLPTLSSFFTSWGQIYLGISFPTIILIVSLIWIPEAPRWLLKNKNDIKEVEAIILRAAEINDRKYLLPSNLRDELHLQATSLKSQPPQAKWLDLWKGPRAKTHFIASHMALAFYIINFMGMLLNTRSFGRDYLAVNTIFTGFSEVIGCFMAMYFSIHLKEKKWQYSGVYNIVAGLIGCTGWFFPDSLHNPERVITWMAISSIGKAGVSFAQSMLLACLPELWSPAKKQPFMFSVVTWARILLLSAPFFNVLKRFDVALSLTSYSVMSVLGGICLCFIMTPASMTCTTESSPSKMDINLTSVWNASKKGCENKSFCDEVNYNTHL